jgi:hypothetical protein
MEKVVYFSYTLSIFDQLRLLVTQTSTRQDTPATKNERLPFTVRRVRTAAELSKALRIRVEAYSRHMPEFSETLRHAEAMDGMDGVVIFLAESKLDGSPLGAMRIQTNRFAPLALEQSIELPPALRAASLAEATRLAVVGDKTGSLVKTILFKAYFLFCEAAGVEWMVVTGRSPIDRQYQRLLFDDVVPGLGYVPIRHVNNIPHRVMSFEIGTAQERWRAANHPLYNFIVHTVHSDIDIGMPLSPRKQSRGQF